MASQYPTTSPSDLKGVVKGLTTAHTANQVLKALNGSPLLKNFGGALGVQYEGSKYPPSDKVTVDVSKNQVLVGGAGSALVVDSVGGPIVIAAGKGGYVDVSGHGAADQADTIIGAAGSYIQGNSAADKLIGGAGPETLVSGGGHDTIVAGSGRDSIDGGGQSSIKAGAGHDTITSNGGMDSITLGKGDVTLNIQGGANDTIYGGAHSGSLTLNQTVSNVASPDTNGNVKITFAGGGSITTVGTVNVVFNDHTSKTV